MYEISFQVWKLNIFAQKTANVLIAPNTAPYTLGVPVGYPRGSPDPRGTRTLGYPQEYPGVPITRWRARARRPVGPSAVVGPALCDYIYL